MYEVNALDEGADNMKKKNASLLKNNAVQSLLVSLLCILLGLLVGYVALLIINPSGAGKALLDIVKNFEAATGVKIPYVIKPRRAGDIATCYSDASLAEKELGWKAENGIKEMCEDSWRWQKNNPNGYED